MLLMEDAVTGRFPEASFFSIGDWEFCLGSLIDVAPLMKGLKTGDTFSEEAASFMLATV